MAGADSSWMHNPKHSWQPACVDNLGQPQPDCWQAAQSEMLTSLQGEARMWGAAGRRGIPPQPTLQCYPNPLALPLRTWSQGAPSQGTSIPHCTPFSAPLLMRASPTHREAQQTGSEHAVGFIWGISRQQCCCLGTLTQPRALPSSCVWGATQPLTKSQQPGKGWGRKFKRLKVQIKRHLPCFVTVPGAAGSHPKLLCFNISIAIASMKWPEDGESQVLSPCSLLTNTSKSPKQQASPMTSSLP